jgi:hypothetical protein
MNGLALALVTSFLVAPAPTGMTDMSGARPSILNACSGKQKRATGRRIGRALGGREPETYFLQVSSNSVAGPGLPGSLASIL